MKVVCRSVDKRFIEVALVQLSTCEKNEIYEMMSKQRCPAVLIFLSASNRNHSVCSNLAIVALFRMTVFEYVKL